MYITFFGTISFFNLFTQVYKGELIGLYGDNSITKVAIKTLKENSAPKIQNDFRREVDLMSEMRHPNIVCLLGVCMRQEPMCMLFEFMVQGDLHEYLIMHSPHSDISVVDKSRIGGGSKILEYPEMLLISTQVRSQIKRGVGWWILKSGFSSVQFDF